MVRSNEPAFWSLFAAGGVVSAVFMPVVLLLTGVAVPAGWVQPDRLLQLVAHPLARVFLFVLISLPLFHWAHRFRYAAADLGLQRLGRALPIACYGAAILGTGFAIVLLLRV